MSHETAKKRWLAAGAMAVLIMVSPLGAGQAYACEEGGSDIVFRTEIVDRGLLPLELLRVRSAEGEPLGELVVVQRLERLQQSSATIAVVAAADGSRAELVYRLDPASGLVTTTLTDLVSGWRAEMEHDLGVSNLGSAEEHGSTDEWLENVGHRLRTQRPPSTFTLTTTDGVAVRWSSQPGEPDATGEALKQAKVELASQFVGVELPPSVSAELSVLATVIHSSGSERLRDFDALLDPLMTGLHLAEVDGVNHSGGEVADLDLEAHADEVRSLLPKPAKGSDR